MTAVIRVAASHPCSSDCEGQPTAGAARGERRGARGGSWIDAVRREKRAHVKLSLPGPMGEGWSHRASPPREAASLATLATIRTAHMSATTRDVIAIRGERADGTGAHARALRAGFARTLADWGARGRQLLRQRKSAAVAVPEPVVSMDEHPERRQPQRLRAPRPGRKWPISRAAKRIQSFGADEARDAVEAAAAPAIERIGSAVSGFRGFLEGVPVPRPDHADQHERPKRSERADSLGVVQPQRPPGSEPCPLDCAFDRCELRNGLAARLVHRGALPRGRQRSAHDRDGSRTAIPKARRPPSRTWWPEGKGRDRRTEPGHRPRLKAPDAPVIGKCPAPCAENGPARLGSMPSTLRHDERTLVGSLVLARSGAGFFSPRSRWGRSRR